MLSLTTDFVGLNREIAWKLGISLETDSIRKMVIEEANSEKEFKQLLRDALCFSKWMPASATE
jgi:hypothetical protein